MNLEGLEMIAVLVVLVLFVKVLEQFGLFEPVSLEGNGCGRCCHLWGHEGQVAGVQSCPQGCSRAAASLMKSWCVLAACRGIGCKEQSILPVAGDVGRGQVRWLLYGGDFDVCWGAVGWDSV